MPAGANPNNKLVLDYIPTKENQLGAFGPVMQDVSRPGLDNLLFIQNGDRGTKVQIGGRQYFNDRQAALDHVIVTEALQGKEVELTSVLEDYTKMVFIHRISGSTPRQVGAFTFKAAGRTKSASWVVSYIMEIQRTN